MPFAILNFEDALFGKLSKSAVGVVSHNSGLLARKVADFTFRYPIDEVNPEDAPFQTILPLRFFLRRAVIRLEGDIGGIFEKTSDDTRRAAAPEYHTRRSCND